MPCQERITVDLAVEILRSATARSGEELVDTAPVRLALHTLWRHCPERWSLIDPSEAASQPDEIGRALGVTAGFSGTMLQLRRSGAYSDVMP